MKLSLPPVARRVLLRLTECGFEAYLVGGAVRDLLLGVPPHDVDVATAARPEEVRAAFSDARVLETGISHGTVTVLFDDGSCAEITTFRTEGAYSDARHPDSVTFVRTLEEDLKRRDFTIGAMALSVDGELLDPMGGREDLLRGVLRAVGDAKTRFSEDALRVLRALRFASEKGFVLEEETRAAAREAAPLLAGVARERLFSEFSRLLLGRDVRRVLLEERQIVAELVPAIRACFEFEQHSRHHCYDVYTPLVHTVSEVEAELSLRLAALYHDLGKPLVFSLSADGEGHFYSHAAESERIAKESLLSFAAPNKLRERVLFLVKHHDAVLHASEKGVRRALARFGEENLCALLKLRRADASAQAREARERHLASLAEFERELALFLENAAAPSLRTLAVNGHDLLALGAEPSARVGAVLESLLALVVEGEIANEREPLLQKARELLKKHS